MTIIPAYGRDYKSKAAVLADWHLGLDFKIAQTGQYINKSDAVNYKVPAVMVRYHKMTKLMEIKITA